MAWFIVRWETKRSLYDHATLDAIEKTKSSELAGFEGPEIVATVEGEHPPGSSPIELAQVLGAAQAVIE